MFNVTYFGKVSESDADRDIKAAAMYHLGILQYNSHDYQNGYSNFNRAEKIYQNLHQLLIS